MLKTNKQTNKPVPALLQNYHDCQGLTVSWTSLAVTLGNFWEEQHSEEKSCVVTKPPVLKWATGLSSAMQNPEHFLRCLVFLSHKYPLKSKLAIWQFHFLQTARPRPYTMSDHYLWIKILPFWWFINSPGILTILFGPRLMASALNPASKQSEG